MVTKKPLAVNPPSVLPHTVSVVGLQYPDTGSESCSLANKLEDDANVALVTPSTTKNALTKFFII